MVFLGWSVALLREGLLRLVDGPALLCFVAGVASLCSSLIYFFIVYEADIYIFIPPPELVMSTSWATTTWRMVIQLERAVYCMMAIRDHVLLRY